MLEILIGSAIGFVVANLQKRAEVARVQEATRSLVTPTQANRIAAAGHDIIASTGPAISTRRSPGGFANPDVIHTYVVPEPTTPTRTEGHLVNTSDPYVRL